MKNKTIHANAFDLSKTQSYISHFFSFKLHYNPKLENIESPQVLSEETKKINRNTRTKSPKKHTPLQQNKKQKTKENQ